MLSRLLAMLNTVRSFFKTQRQLTLENLVLRQQLTMLKPSVKRPQVLAFDRLFWVLFSKYVDGWRTMLHALHPDTIVKVFDTTGTGKAGAGTWADHPSPQKYASSSNKCSRKIWLGRSSDPR